MNRVLKRMTGVALAAVLLVSMGMTAAAKGVTYSDLSEPLQMIVDEIGGASYTLEELKNALDTYIKGGEWKYQGIPISVEDARLLWTYLNGDSSDTSDEKKESVKTVNEKIQDKAVKEIDKALQTDSDTAAFDGRNYGINTLSRDLMGEINKSGVSMVFKYTYNGYYYEITIPAGQAPTDPDVPWCGPMYLYSLFSDTAVVTPVA